MTTQQEFDLRNISDNQPSICIPRVFDNIDEKRIRNIIDQLCIGKIRRIDIVERKSENESNGRRKPEKFNRVFIHFDAWHSNPAANDARKNS